MRQTLTALLVALSLVGPARAVDWPQWLGPMRDGSTTETVKPWKGKLNEVWRKPIGEGNGAPIIAGGKVFLMSKVKDKNREEIVAFDAASGKELWRSAYERKEFASPYGNGPRGTPAVVDGKLYSLGVTGLLTCFNVADGSQVWQVDTLKKFNGKNLFFGMAGSPLVEGGRVLVNVGAKGASVVAFDAGTGEVAWQSQDDPASYASPIAFGKGDARQVVFLTGKGLISLAPADGKLFWRYELIDRLFESSTTPVHVGDQIVASAITYGTDALDLGIKDGTPTASKAWHNGALTSYFSTPVAAGDGYLFLVAGTTPDLFNPKPSSATLHCVDLKTGKTTWSRPKVGEFHASMVRLGDGKVLLLEERGELVLIQPDAKEYKELARAKVCGRTWAHPAVANGCLFVRDDHEVICLRFAE